MVIGGRKLLGIVLLSSLCSIASARQGDPAVPQKKQDSGFLFRMRSFGKKETINSIEKYRNGKIAIQQEKLLQELRYTSERARIFLRKGIDTASYLRDLANTKAELAIVEDGVFVNEGTGHTTRNLAVSSAVLSELLLTMNERRASLGKYIKTLTDFVDRIDSLSADSALYTFPFDSVQTIQYIRTITVVAKDLGPADSALRKSITSLHQLQTDIDLLGFDIRSRLEEVELFRKQQIARTFDKEFAYLWEPPSHHRPFNEIVQLSVAKEKLALGYYLRDFQGRLFILLLLLAAAWYFLRSLKQQWMEQKGLDPHFQGQLVLRYPFLSALILVLNIFQFIFLQPPFIFGFMLWLVAAISLAILFYRFVTPFWMRFWIVMVLCFVLAGGTNMLLQASRIERWWMLLLSLGGAIYGAYILRGGKLKELKEKGILYFIAFMVIMEVLSAIFNFASRYNLSKTLLVSGYAGLVIAILFLWTVRLINEGLGLIAGIYRRPDRKLFYIDFNRVGEKVPSFFYVFLVVGWFILVGRNFYAFQQAATPFMEFLTTDRTVGSYTFTINSLFIFVIIIAVSTILSQIISFFAGEPGDQRNKDKKARKPGLGSWLLLIRIIILSLGLFLAIAAAGIPLDKLTIVLGALGVGIGLGLQGLVSNLVSGLIIAFEKPVNVGDIIEVNGHLGTMKSIGFRSSVVTLIDGACLIVPNGDLLSHHLVNWTMGNNKRRLNIVISVAYGTNLKNAISVLLEVLTSNGHVMQYPEPVVSVKAFGDSSIDLDLYFWVGHVRDYLSLRSEVITLVDEAFRKEGIVIPFPQRDVHIIDGKEQGPAQ